MRGSSDYLTTSFQEQFKFFPYVVIYVVLFYFCIAIVFAYSFMNTRYVSKFERKDPPTGKESCCELCCTYVKGMFCCCCKLISKLCSCFTRKRPALFFDTIYESHWALLGALLLLTGRVVLAAFLVYYSLYLSYLEDDKQFLYLFPAWVNICLAIYFISSSIASFFGLLGRLCCFDEEFGAVRWSPLTEHLGVVILILYEMGAVNILFLLVINYSFLSSQANFKEVRVFLVPAGAVIYELLFNRLPFRPVYYGFVALLPMAYLLFQWVLVYTGQLSWQYVLLETQHAICFRRYSVMIGIHVGVFILLAGLYALRDHFFGIKYSDRFREDLDDMYEDAADGVDANKRRHNPDDHIIVSAPDEEMGDQNFDPSMEKGVAHF